MEGTPKTSGHKSIVECNDVFMDAVGTLLSNQRTFTLFQELQQSKSATGQVGNLLRLGVGAEPVVQEDDGFETIADPAKRRRTAKHTDSKILALGGGVS